VGLFFIRSTQVVRVFTFAVFVLELIFALPLLRFRINTSEFQFVERLTWVEGWGLEYYLGIDGIAVLMVGLTLIIFPLCVLCSWSSIATRVKEFHFCLLLLCSACVGLFSALDLLLFYLFWEATLIPVYLIIAIWGGSDRQYASLKFIIYTLAGSALLLVGIIAFRIEGGTFSIPELMGRDFPFGFQIWTFLVMALAFAVKVPMFPFHTWLLRSPCFLFIPGFLMPMQRPPLQGAWFSPQCLPKWGLTGFCVFLSPWPRTQVNIWRP